MKILESTTTTHWGRKEHWLHIGCRKPFLRRDAGGYWGILSRRQRRTLEKRGNIVVAYGNEERGWWFEVWPR